MSEDELASLRIKWARAIRRALSYDPVDIDALERLSEEIMGDG